MIQEAFCSFEIAKLLKEKGFDELCIFKYNSEGIKVKAGKAIDEWSNTELEENECSAPTHQRAMRWLREVHNKHCDVGYDIDLRWFFQIIDLKETVEYDYPETKYYHYHTANESGFNSYEEAVEAALKYVLENLI